MAMRISEEEMEIRDDKTTKKPRHLSEKSSSSNYSIGY